MPWTSSTWRASWTSTRSWQQTPALAAPSPARPRRQRVRIRFLELDTILNRIAYARPISESELGFLVTFADRLKKTASAPAPAIEEVPVAPSTSPGRPHPRRRRLPRSPLDPRPPPAPTPKSGTPAPQPKAEAPEAAASPGAPPGARAGVCTVVAGPVGPQELDRCHQAKRQQGDPDGPLPRGHGARRWPVERLGGVVAGEDVGAGPRVAVVRRPDSASSGPSRSPTFSGCSTWPRTRRVPKPAATTCRTSSRTTTSCRCSWRSRTSSANT